MEVYVSEVLIAPLVRRAESYALIFLDASFPQMTRTILLLTEHPLNHDPLFICRNLFIIIGADSCSFYLFLFPSLLGSLLFARFIRNHCLITLYRAISRLSFLNFSNLYYNTFFSIFQNLSFLSTRVFRFRSVGV